MFGGVLLGLELEDVWYCLRYIFINFWIFFFLIFVVVIKLLGFLKNRRLFKVWIVIIWKSIWIIGIGIVIILFLEIDSEVFFSVGKV